MTGNSATGSDLKLISVTKRFHNFVAVDQLSLEIPAGSFFALLGPSGCGKTTTLRMVAGLEEPTAGRIFLGKTDVTWTKPYKRPVNTVFQNYALFPHLSIFENVAFGLRRQNSKDITARTKAALELVELGHLAERKPHQLSGGQQQRIALARAVVNRPSLLLLDEPLGALDLKLRRQMQLELKRIQTEVGLTFVHVTHDQEEAMTMADTIAVMNEGRIEQLGSPVELYESPRTAFVANFLGQSNLMMTTIVGAEQGAILLNFEGNRIRMPKSRNITGSETQGGLVQIGVRPEKLAISRLQDGQRPELNVISGGTIIDASFFGVSTQYVVDFPWGSSLTVFEQNLGTAGILPVGTQVQLQWSPEHTFSVTNRPGSVPEPATSHSPVSTTRSSS